MKHIDLSKYGSNQAMRKKYFCPSSISHPAKMDLPLCRWIIDKFCNKDKPEIILDPMCGIGSTLIMGMLMRPQSLFIGIELEDKFVKMTQDNINKVEKLAERDMFLKVGRATVIKGDARNLQGLLNKEVDKIISSPPYGEGLGHPHGTKVKSKLSLMAKEKGMNIGEYSKEKGKNIGDLPHGEISRIITSPPFGGQVQHKTNYLGRQTRMIAGSDYSDNPENIGNLKHGDIDKIISSPPFGPATSGRGIAKGGYKGKHGEMEDIGKRSYMPENVGETEGNLSNLPYVEKIISSPPYEGSISTRTDEIKRAERLSKMRERKGHYSVEQSKSYSVFGDFTYSSNDNNIGNTKGQNYLEAMLLVYKECWRVLRPKGLLILVVKDFIRDKKRIPLGEDTIKLCELAGFTYLHTYYRKIENPSFWRKLYEQKFPEVEKIENEDILVFKK